ncbi:type III-B CRISPR-associated protein Cas10/Cmr2 [Pelodictyon phaeoclathratiforme]|uniref:type III-B CRISPR-associated protein Cas10/Cmr2 n=1 Tax=Pelodictyon phaeoclathratiforme TaxID=34090 RepID=UPI0002F24E8C|nr:hypothetical protein [Pelodictyon phaeoclathratiforme]
MSSTQYLFLFTIGSPQTFIAQARKTHDLFAGSAVAEKICRNLSLSVSNNTRIA